MIILRTIPPNKVIMSATGLLLELSVTNQKIGKFFLIQFLCENILFLHFFK